MNPASRATKSGQAQKNGSGVSPYPFKLLSCDTHLEHWPTVLADFVPKGCHDLLASAPLAVKLFGTCDLFGPKCVPVNVMAGIGRNQDIAPGKFDIATQQIPGAYGGGREYLSWLDIDNIDVGVLHPGAAIGATVGASKQLGTETYLEVLRGYNNWLSDFCSVDPERLFGAAMLPLNSIDEAIKELERVRNLPGIRTISPAAFPNGSTRPEPEDDRFWAATLDLGMPVTLHGGLSSPFTAMKDPKDAAMWIVGHTEVTTGGPFTAAQLILSGLFDRLPDLSFLICECGASWLPFTMGTMNHLYSRHRYWAGFDIKYPPSWYLTSGNLIWNLCDDHAAVKLRDQIGVSNLTWSSDFPHANSEYPNSSICAAELTEGTTDQERYDILWGNAARFYRIEGRA